MLDPFDETAGEGAPAPEPQPSKKPRRVRGTRKITYSAVCVAIGTLCSVVAVYLPIKLMPLVLAAFCFYAIFERCGFVYGFLTEAAVLLGTFLVGGVAMSATFMFLAVVFVPYAPIAYAMRKLTYSKIKPALLRGAIVAVFVNLTFLAVFYILQAVVLGGGFDLLRIANFVGGYWVVALCLIPLSVSVDFLFVSAAKYLDKVLK